MNNIKININLKKDCGNLLANADITLTTIEFGVIVLKDFQIWKSSKENSRLEGEHINIQPPVVKYVGKFRPRIFFENERVWEEIERQIWNMYTLKTIEEDERSEIKEVIISEEEAPF